MSIGIGAISGAMNPRDAFTSLAFGVGGAVIGQLSAQDAARGYLIGSQIGGALSPGLEDMFKKAPALHTASRMAVGLTTWGVGFAAGQMTGGVDNGIAWGNFSSMAGQFLANFIKCFPAGTPILTPNGSVPIEQLRAGDHVLSRNEFNVEGDVAPKVIEETFCGVSRLVSLSLGGKTIRCTAEHPFFVRNKGWTAAADLQPGQQLATDTDAWICLDAITSTDTAEPIYNFRVADWHTYFVGGNDWAFGVWVHNSYRSPKNATGGKTPTEIAQELGKKGEKASGIAKNTLRIESLSGKTQFRIPDGPTSTTLTEVKNVTYQYFSKQLQDFLHYSIMTGRQMILKVRPDSVLSQESQELQDAISAGWIMLEFI